MIEVSVIVVVRNEERYIVECIESIASQFEKEDQWELLIIDGESDDNTVQKSKAFLKTAKYDWSILNNPKKTLAPGWNIGIKAAKGTFVVRPDAHATLHPLYVKHGIETLKKDPTITAVGGLLDTKAKGYWGDIIKEALSSKVGVGNSSFRTNTKSGFSDTAVYAVYRKEVFDKVGYFNEKLVRHQDNDMHQRIKAEGGLFYLNVNMKADYYCRDTVPKLNKQMFNIGKYLPDVMFDGSLSLRHFIPFVFYLSLLLGFVLGFSIHQYFTILTSIVAIFYMGVIILTSVKASFQNIRYLWLILIIPLIHLNYAAGTFWGLLIKPFK